MATIAIATTHSLMGAFAIALAWSQAAKSVELSYEDQIERIRIYRVGETKRNAIK